ncbi:discoidin domain-containing protein [Microbispora sp. NEAU-D428]|uniref:discoidin domain-containing protein n=1 Tax=Microbispora sitophila TaxID=2771537 RepID=UPI00186833D3|nr:discoidin domain-containing protein [Microbispora sitophila]MBE3010646.1 discoidin domain-containing protein [Microbispora sitophila]
MRRLTLGIVTALALAATPLATTSAAAADTGPVTYYVDAQGDDSAAGTSPETAWKSLEKVNSAGLHPGDTVRFQGGDTWHGGLVITSSGTPGAPITITSYGQGRPLIAGDTLVDAAVTIANAHDVVVSGLEVTNSTDLSASKSIDYRGIFAIAKDIGEVAGVVVKDNYVHDIDGKGTSRIGRGGIVVGVRGNTTPTWYSDLLIEGNEVSDSNGYGISTFTTWCAGCEIYSPETGVPASEVSKTRKAFARPVFRDNYVHDVAGGGITPQYSDDALVEWNTVDRAAAHRLVPGGGNVGIWWQGTNRITVQYNVSRRTGFNSLNQDPTDMQGFDADMGTSGSLVQYNYSDSNAGGFFLCLISANNVTLRYNVSRRDYFRPFSLWSGCWNFRGYNNTIWGTADTVPRNRADGTKYEQPVEAFVRNQSPSGNLLFNNIFYNPARATFDCRSTCSFNGNDIPMNYGHNLYWDESGSPVVPRTDSKPIIGDPKLAAPGTELPDEGKISRADLLKVLRAYTPAPDSPAIDAGVSIGPGADILGTAVPAGPADLGAIQHPVETHAATDFGPHAEALVDGDPATSWTATKATGKIMIKYGEPRTLDGIHLLAASSGPTLVDVTARNADGEWVTQVRDRALSWSGGSEWLRVPFPAPIAATEVRVIVKAATGRVTLNEVRGTLGTVAAATATPGGSAQTTLGTSIGDIQAIDDGNAATSWASADNPKLPGTLSVNWSTPHTIDAVQVTVAWGQGQGPTLVDVQTKNADGTWTTRAADQTLTWKLNSTTPESPIIAFPAPVAAYGIRLVVKKANLIWGHLAVYEFTAMSGGSPVREDSGTDKLPDAQQAVDGDPATVWIGAEVAGTGLQIDPGAPQTVSSITLTSPEGYRPTRIRVEARAGGVWRQVLPATDLTWNGDTATVALPRTTATTFYLIVDKSPGQYALAEVTLG